MTTEFPAEPDIIEYLGGIYGYVGQRETDDVARLDGDMRADRIIDAWAKNELEKAFLEALSAGHEIAEARRITGISRYKADACLRRIRGS